MKSKYLLPLGAALCSLFTAVNPLHAQGTAFTYQGRLADGPNAANGSYDLRFYLRDALLTGNPVGATNTVAPVSVSNGLFTVTLDFGGGIFTGPSRWLEIGVRSNGSAGAYTTLSPRQALTPNPYATFAGNIATNTIATANVQDSAITSAKIASGQVVKSLNGLMDSVTLSVGANVTLTTNGNSLQLSSSGGATSGWALGGNAGTTSANFLGTLDLHPLELRANNQRVLRLEPNGPGPFSSPNLIGGFSGNTGGSGVSGNTIGGGGAAGYTQRALGNFGTIGGGIGNLIQTNIYESTIAGGNQNVIASAGIRSTIGGGFLNSISGEAATIGGGQHNMASGSSATVAGGEYNQASDFDATIGGGNGNLASGFGSTIAGGYGNGAGQFSSVAGGDNNNAEAAYSSIGGGYGNYSPGLFGTVAGGAVNTSSGQYATIGGGTNNTASGIYSTVAGGIGNLAATSHAVVSGGNANSVLAGASVIGGGQINQIAAGAVNAVIGGGYNNHISASGISATIPGGSGNTALGFGSFAAGQNSHANHNGSFVWGDGTAGAYSGGPNRFDVLATGGVGFFVAGGSVTIDSAGTLTIKVLTITGGADVAEPFQMSSTEIPEGAVVIIDDENPGHLKLSERPYDQRVAGIVSGANGIKPGISLSQQGLMEGGQNVALSGRVYVLADATRGAIKPGDLLTTSDTPGHAMKVANHGKAQGAILGKAMSSLKQGKGMVLVLVTLQ